MSKRQKVEFSQFDPYYVQISRLEFARLLGRSASEFDKLRRRDDRMPEAIPTSKNTRSRTLFRLSECYAYSELLIQDARQGKFS